jgi:hypothetical protein
MTARLPAALAAALALAACSGPKVLSPDAMNASYDAALARSSALAVELPGGDDGARQALAGVEDLFTDMQPEAVRGKVAALYAEGAYFNDNLAVMEGAAAIADHLAHTAGNIQGIGLDVLEISHSGVDYFARWRMTVTARRLNQGKPMVSYGVTHFRFDADGRVLLHKDFWDAGTGLYEFIPGLRGLLQRVRAGAQPQ